MIDKTGLIEFTSYRFQNRKFLFSKEDLKEYRKRENEIFAKEMDLLEFVKDKEVKTGR